MSQSAAADVPWVKFLRSLSLLIGDLVDELDVVVGVPPTLRESAAESGAALPKVRGPRQQQMVQLSGMRTVEGRKTGEIARAIDYDQPNVWSTLKVLATDKVVEQVSSPGPQRWRLTSRFRDGDTG